MACPVSGEGTSQLTQACAARCTHPGRPRQSLAPHLPSPTGERQRSGSEGHSHPQSRVHPGTEGSACSEPGSWAARGRAKLLLLPLPNGPFFCPSCPSMLPQPHALSCKCSCLTVPITGASVQHSSSSLLPCWQHPLLGAAPGCSPTGAQDVGISGGAASTLALWFHAPVPNSHRPPCAAGLSLLLSQWGNGVSLDEATTNGERDGRGNPYSRPLRAGSFVSLP